MTLNGAMTVILRFSPNSVALRADYAKVVKIDLYSLRQKCSPRNLVFSDISLISIFVEVTENERIIDRHLRGIQCESKKVAPLKLFAIFSLTLSVFQ